MVGATEITAVVLAGGRGLRMGGVDKGLQLYNGLPLALHVLRRLQPQVGHCVLSANRHAAQYAALGVPVLADVVPGFAGPLAGILTALQHCTTPFLLAVPCDSPLFPLDLATRLSQPLAAPDCDMAIAVTPDVDAAGTVTLRAHPVFCLMRTGVRQGLEDFIARGERKIGAWAAAQLACRVPFDDAQAFLNINTLRELQALSQ